MAAKSSNFLKLYRQMTPFFQIILVFEEPLHESNTERQHKYQSIFQTKAPNNIFIVKFENAGAQFNMENKDFLDSKNLHLSVEGTHFCRGVIFWGCGKFLEGTNSGG